jgi:hypothetical protein
MEKIPFAVKFTDVGAREAASTRLACLATSGSLGINQGAFRKALRPERDDVSLKRLNQALTLSLAHESDV